MKKISIIIITMIIYQSTSRAQIAVPVEIQNDDWPNNHRLSLLEFSWHKKLPPGFEWQALEALSHFRELKETRIRFRIKQSFCTARTRPIVISMFLPKKLRSYVIIISNQSAPVLQKAILQQLPHAAQIGLLGHEISHVADFSQKNLLQAFITAFNHLFPKRIDKFEYHTDQIAIEHGLGENLEAWSSYIRNTFHTKNWRGARYVNVKNVREERYMNPDTIEKRMQNPGATTNKPGVETAYQND